MTYNSPNILISCKSSDLTEKMQKYKTAGLSAPPTTPQPLDIFCLTCFTYTQKVSSVKTSSFMVMRGLVYFKIYHEIFILYINKRKLRI